jgi:hypothetical protein
MYTLLYIILVGIAVVIAYSGIKNKKRGSIIAGVTFGLLTVLFFWFMNFWGEKLWFDQNTYINRFWTEWATKFILLFAGLVIGGLVVYLLTFSLPREKRYQRLIAVLFGALLTGIWWFSRWDLLLKYTNRLPTEITDPILNQQAGFYLFTLPFLNALYSNLLILMIISLAANLVSVLQPSDDQRSISFRSGSNGYKSTFVAVAMLFIILAIGKYLNRFELLYSDLGVVSGPGWTDANIRLPFLFVTGIITLLFGLLLLLSSFRTWLQKVFTRKNRPSQPVAVLIGSASIFGVWIILLGIVPFLFQWLKVEPNEITVERPYIENNIEYTRIGFDLEKVEENEFPASEEFNRQMVQNNQNLFSNIRLWDYRALDAVFKQFQEIRLYYEFSDVDIDRYHIDGDYREVMISAREMEVSNLPPNSQTFVNKRFKYTHGYGAVLTKVNEFTPEGLPNLLIRDIPPITQYQSLEIDRPEIYYGELTENHVIVNSEEEEFDYPSGENNIYTRYKGNGGVPISNFWRKFLYGWKFDGTKLLLSGYPTRESRIMMHRDIKERVNTLAPFLFYDDDPYIVLANGELYWIIDAYTTSNKFPYSEPFASVEQQEVQQLNYDRSMHQQTKAHLRGKNYIRNSVKVVVNAYSGQTNFYTFEDDDPIINVYDKIFPELFTDKSEMPSALRKHVRYPIDMLLVQGLVYAKYHMTDPTVFYNQEDLWVRATEKYYNNVQPVEPYYIMWEPPGTNEMEFILMLPFTPKNKQVMIGWIAGMCDNDNYGRFLAYKFPKEKRVLGPQQVETKIDQDSFLSGQLTLWDQRGSNVIRGNVLAIPIDETIIYVEPIYLQSETAAYPELRLVAIMHGDNLSYAENFEDALQGLFTGEPPARQEGARATGITGDETMQEMIGRANDAFENYLQYMQQKQFEDAASALRELESTLNRLSKQEDSQTNKHVE